MTPLDRCSMSLPSLHQGRMSAGSRRHRLLRHRVVWCLLVPSWGMLPMLEHCLDGLMPFVLKACRQLLDLFVLGRVTTPHFWSSCFCFSIRGNEIPIGHRVNNKRLLPRTTPPLGTYSSLIFTRHNQAKFQLRFDSGSLCTRDCAPAKMLLQNG